MICTQKVNTDFGDGREVTAKAKLITKNAQEFYAAIDRKIVGSLYKNSSRKNG